MYDISETADSVIYRDRCEGKTLALPKRNFGGLYSGKNPAPIKDESAFLKSVLNPVSGERLSTIAAKKNAKTAAIVISDITRGVPTHTVAGHLVDELVKGGLRRENITFYVGLGVHRPSTTEEMRTFVGSGLFEGGVKIVNHDAFDESNLLDLGYTSRGTPVQVNKAACLSDVKITVGKVELHEMAGFSGGRKSILPGISSEKTILVNHRPEMIFDPGSGAGNLEGNPIHEDMLEAAKMSGVDFSVNFVLDNSNRPAAVFSGGLEESHAAAVAFVRPFVTVRAPSSARIFVTTPGRPLNCDMYQGVKAIIALQHCLGAGKAVIFYGAFPEGMNSRDFIEPLGKYPGNLDKARKYAWNNFKIQMDHTLPMIDIIKTGVHLIAVAPTVDPKDLELLRMIRCETLDEALEKAFGLTSSDASVAFLPQPWRAIVRLAD